MMCYRFTACRCYYLSQYYAAEYKWYDVMTLLDEHAIELCDTATDKYKQYKSNGGSVVGVQHKIDQLHR
jgi:hypothetical protein